MKLSNSYWKRSRWNQITHIAHELGYCRCTLWAKWNSFQSHSNNIHLQLMLSAWVEVMLTRSALHFSCIRSLPAWVLFLISFLWTRLIYNQITYRDISTSFDSANVLVARFLPGQCWRPCFNTHSSSSRIPVYFVSWAESTTLIPTFLNTLPFLRASFPLLHFRNPEPFHIVAENEDYSNICTNHRNRLHVIIVIFHEAVLGVLLWLHVRVC